MSVLIAALISLLSQKPVSTGLSGHLMVMMDPDFRGSPATVDCAFKQDAKKLIVRCDNGSSDVTGTVNGLKIRWRSPPDRRNAFTLSRHLRQRLINPR